MKLLLSLCLFAVAAPLLAQTMDVKDVINRARATVGTDESLDGLVTLQIAGVLRTETSKTAKAEIRIVARKPSSQRMEVRMGDLVEAHILRSEDEGSLVRSNRQTNKLFMRDLNPEELKNVLYSTRQFFSFYRPDFRNGEIVTYEGIEQRRGIRCHKLVYTYRDGLSTTRYFSVNDDKLVSTISNKNLESVGIGVQSTGGIRFPEAIEYYENGQKLHTIYWTSILANKPLQEGVFDIPVAQKK